MRNHIEVTKRYSIAFTRHPPPARHSWHPSFDLHSGLPLLERQLGLAIQALVRDELLLLAR